MFTVCPKCALTLAVTAADLRVGQGYVRCGRCASVFNALVALHEEARRDEAAPSTPAERRAATPSPPPPPLMMELPVTTEPGSETEPAPDTMEFALGSADLAQIFVAPEVAEGAAVSGTFESIVLEGEFNEADADEAIDTLTRELEEAEAELERIAQVARDAVADPGSATQQSEALQVSMAAPAGDRFAEHYYARAEDIDAFEEPARHSRASLWYGIAAGALAVLLLAQIVHRNRNDLASSPVLHGPLTSLYGALGAPLAPRWDPAALDVRQLGAIAEADASGQLLVRADRKFKPPLKTRLLCRRSHRVSPSLALPTRSPSLGRPRRQSDGLAGHPPQSRHALSLPHRLTGRTSSAPANS
ncbi:MAG: hypothetical protein CMLOHMNK_03022 [Steroidobacteraceae bacterium]|nr:hypothetical protein [Steroidobacteraceae bacterium]